MSSTHNITAILELAGQGDREATHHLFSVVYDELRRLAGHQMTAESREHTLESTALVHEVWLKLFGQGDNPAWQNRRHFFATAARAMRRILIDSARARKRLKRGGEAKKFQIREDDLIADTDDQLIALDEALDRLREADEKKCKLVELRFFAGMTSAEAAEHLEISTATAERYWNFSKAWLRSKMEAGD